MLFAVCEETESRKRTTRGSRVPVNRPASPPSSSGSEEASSFSCYVLISIFVQDHLSTEQKDE